MRRAVLVAVLCATAAPAAAQRFVVGPSGFLLGDYREVSNDLRYGVSGFGGAAVLTLGRFAAEASFASLSYEPRPLGTASEPFDATQFDGYLRYRVLPWASLELGVTSRDVRDEFRAQSVAAFRVGAHSTVALGPYAGVAARLNYLAGARFSGGGSAPFAMDVGLSVYHGFARGRIRLAGESQLQRFNRTVRVADATQDVPIQQIVTRLGLAVGF